MKRRREEEEKKKRKKRRKVWNSMVLYGDYFCMDSSIVCKEISGSISRV